jgi:ribosomal protein L11 methyltransferase
MDWWRSLVVEVEADAANAFAEALLERGALAASIEDALADTQDAGAVFDEAGVAGMERWARTRVQALFSPDADVETVFAAATEAVGLAPTRVFAIERVADCDWVRHSQDQFRPTQISSRLWIVPSWHEPPDPAGINITLDPGLAFGTGSHATTRLCLRWLEQRVYAGAEVLDYGCGSGILAIAALKLGAGLAVGVDVDLDAVAAARQNAARNRVSAIWLGADTQLEFRADLIVANILANPLKILAPLLAAHCRSGGRIALAGILESQAEEVTESYQAWFAMSQYDREDGWIALEGVRR